MSGGSIRLWDNKKGAAVPVDLEHAADALRSGEFSALAGKPIPIYVHGSLGEVAPEGIVEALARGASFVPEKEYRAKQDEIRYGSRSALAAGAGALRGAGEALGVPTDKILKDLAPYADNFAQREGDVYRPNYVAGAERNVAAMRKAEEHNPGASMLGTGAGMVIGAIGTGGGIGAAGEEIGALTGRKVLGRAAGFGLENAMMGAVDATNESALTGEPLTGQKLAAHMAMSGGLGMGLGLGMSGVGALGSAAWKGAKGAVGVSSLEALGSLANKVTGIGGTIAEEEAKLGRVLRADEKARFFEDAGRKARFLSDDKVAEPNAYGRMHAGVDGLVRPGTDIGLTAEREAFARETLKGSNAAGEHARDILDRASKSTKETVGGWSDARDAVRDAETAVMATRIGENERQKAVADLLKGAKELERKAAKAEEREAQGLAKAGAAEAKELEKAEARFWKADAALTVTPDTPRRTIEQSKALGEAFETARREYEALRARPAPAGTNGSAALREQAEVLRVRAAASTPADDIAHARVKLEEASRQARDAAHPLMEQYERAAERFDALMDPSTAKNDGDWYARLREAKALSETLGAKAKAQAEKTLDPALVARANEHNEAAKAIGEMLRDEKVFGRAAAMENKLRPLVIAQRAAEENALPGFATKQYDAQGRRIWVVDPQKLSARAKESLFEATNHQDALKRSNLREYVAKTRELHEVLERELPISGESRKASEAIRKAADEVEGGVRDAADYYVAKNELQGAGLWGGANPTSIRSNHGALLGGVVFGAPGALLGGALAAAADPAQRAAHILAAERATMMLDKRLGTSWSDFFVSKGKFAPKAKAPSASAMDRPAFEASVKEVQEAMTNPAAMRETVTKSLGAFGEGRPGVTAQVAATVMRGITHLAAHVPDGMTPSPEVGMPHLEASMYSDAEMARWSRRAAIVRDPASILDRMNEGSATSEEVETLREVHPELAEYMKVMGLKQLATQTVKPGMQQRQQLELLLDVPMGLSGTVEVMRIFQMPPPGRAGGRKAKSRSGLRLPALSLPNYQTNTQTPYGSKK